MRFFPVAIFCLLLRDGVAAHGPTAQVYGSAAALHGNAASPAFLRDRSRQTASLANRHLRVDFGPRGIAAIIDRTTGKGYRFVSDGFALTIGERAIESSALPLPTRVREAGQVTYTYSAADFTLRVRYELRPGWAFVSKQIEVSSRGPEEFRVRDISLLRETLADAPSDVYLPPSARQNLQTGVYGAALRFGSTAGLLITVQNPFLVVARDGRDLTVRYAPDMVWRTSDGAFTSDRALVAATRLTGRRLPATMIPEWQAGRTAADSLPGMDEAEVSAFTGMVRSFLLDRRRDPITVFVGWCANDYQIDVGTTEGRAEYRRLFDQAAALGARYVLYAPSNSTLSRREASVDDWSWEHVLWLGLGQKIRRGEWDPRSSPVPSSVREMLDYARAKHLGLLAYVYPVLPFAQNATWLVPSRNDPRRRMASLGNRALQDWLIDKLVAFHERTGISGYAFDHTFLTFDGTSRYAQWWGWRRVMEELRRRIPDVVIDGRQAYHLYGPWSWLAGSYPHPTFNDEQPESFTPYPDLHFDRVSADRERYTAYRYRNYEFAPSEIVPGFITHQTSRSNDQDQMPNVKTADRGTVLTPFRVRDWDYLGWRYSLLSSIAVAGWNNVLNMIPARDSAEYRHFAQADRDWLRRWLDWTVAHKEFLRKTRTILGQPALGKVDGTSAMVGDRGFVFLFNPDGRRLAARFALDASVGLQQAGRYQVRELYPLEGRRLGKPRAGTWAFGDSVQLTLDGGSAVVLEVTPASRPIEQPILFNAPGTAGIDGRTLVLTNVRGEPGTAIILLVQLPATSRVARARVNGHDVPLGPRVGDVVEIPVRFDGTEFHQRQPVVVFDSSFAGGRVTAAFTIPKRIFDQTEARRRAWPIPWTADDSVTTWLVPERLLLYLPVAGGDDRWDARLTIDGRPVELRKAYTAVRAVPSTFVGFYADVSRLAPDRPYQIELTLPSTKPGTRGGLFFENVEPEFTTAIRR